MMTNKWVQTSLIGGIAFGIWLGGWIAMVHPMAFLVVPLPIGVLSAWLAARARGTDGWNGRYGDGSQP
jgi:hypothetical protein